MLRYAHCSTKKKQKMDEINVTILNRKTHKFLQTFLSPHEW